MSRLPYLSRDQLGADGQRVWDSITDTRGSQVIGGHGELTGPFNAFVHAPDIGQHLSALGAAIRFGTSIEPALRELAIITVAARWKAEFEWHAHARMASELGLPDTVIDAIARDEDPELATDDEQAVFTVARQVTRTGRVSQDAYDAARRLLGDAGTVELVSLCGYYSLVSFLLNTFEVPLPPGTPPTWDT